MKRQRSRPASWGGYTVLELLVALTASLMLVGILMGVYIGAVQARRQAQAVLQMTEDADAALGILALHLRQAAFDPDAAAAARGGLVDMMGILGCDGAFVSATTSGTLPQCETSKTDKPDSLMVAYRADRYNTVPDADHQATDCTGAGLAAAAGSGPGLVQNRFYVSNGSLMCVGNGASGEYARPVALVDNVEDVRFLFGVSAPLATSSAAVSGYLKASQIGTRASDNQGVFADVTWLALTPAQRWSRVKSVRVCLIMKSPGPMLDSGGVQPASYVDCDGQLRTIDDRRLRRAYGMTVLLRNRLA